MADIQLTRAEADGHLPSTCMRCGAPASHWVTKTFALREPNLGGGVQFAPFLMIRAIVAVTNMPRMQLRTSFCPQHRHYWNLRFGLLFGGMIGFFALAFIGLAVVLTVIFKTKTESHLPDGILFVSLVAYAIVWLIPTMLVLGKSIRVRGASLDEVVLQNVDGAYVKAIEAQRRSHEADSPPAPEVSHAIASESVLPRARRATVNAGNDGGPERSTPRDKKLNGLSLPVLIGLLACIPVVLTCCCGFAFFAAFMTTPAQNGPVAVKRTPATLPPIDAFQDGRERFYLSDMNEINPQVGYGHFGKNGQLGYGIGGAEESPITVADRLFPKAISTAPPHHGMATVQYALKKKFRDFRAWIAVNDLTDTDRTGPETALTFKVVGDGKILWTSDPVRLAETVQDCQVNVQGVNTLELQVHCPGVMHCARAVWLQPHLLK